MKQNTLDQHKQYLIDRTIQLYKDGYKMKEIAGAVGMTYSWVYKQIRLIHRQEFDNVKAK